MVRAAWPVYVPLLLVFFVAMIWSEHKLPPPGHRTKGQVMLCDFCFAMTVGLLVGGVALLAMGAMF